MLINLPGTLFHKSMKARRELAQILAKILSLRRSTNKEDQNDLLGSFMEEKEGLSDEQITDNIIGVIFAARDTTASVLTWIVKYLAENPTVLQAVTPHIENGDKIIMPPSALDRLASLHIDYPMLLELLNASTERLSHCGVLEFSAEEGLIYIPYWMMENLLLQEGHIVRVKNVTLPKGTYVKLEPHTSDFLNISNPKAIFVAFWLKFWLGIIEGLVKHFKCVRRVECPVVSAIS